MQHETAPRDQRTVVVTGAAGFVGFHAVSQLSSTGRFRVKATDVGTSESSAELAALPGVSFEPVDLRDRSQLAPLVEGCDTIVHLAAVRTQAAAANPREAHEVNVAATYDLLTEASLHGVRRVVFGSSHTVYGSFQDPNAAYFREDQPWPCRGMNMYAATKLAAEAYLEAFAVGGGPSYVSLRLGTIYGPRVSAGSNGAITFDVLSALDRGERPKVPWASTARHALIHVYDVTEAITRSIDCTPSRLALNVVGAPVTSSELYGTLVSLYGGDAARLEWNQQRTRHQLVSNRRMVEVLDFTPVVELTDGLKSVIEWYRSRG